MPQIVMEGGGMLSLTASGPRAEFYAEREADDRGLYKVWLTGAEGGRFLLGTMVPENGKLTLRRTVSRGELERSHCWPPVRAEADLAFPFSEPETWRCEECPARLIRDPVLRAGMPGSILLRRTGNGFQTAVPLRTDCPLPLHTLFCLAQPSLVMGALHLVWTFDSSGSPVLPDGARKN